MPYPVNGSTIQVLDRYLYVMGGYSNSGPNINSGVCARVLRLDLNNPTGTWEVVLPLPNYVFAANSAVAKNTLFIVGGPAFAGDTSKTTFRLRQNSNSEDLSQLASIGRIILVQHPRYGYSAGKPMLIIGTETDNSTRKTTLDLWG
jgi:N-acetylneuraminic acid mutarotase